jgi:hypothetical protein
MDHALAALPPSLLSALPSASDAVLLQDEGQSFAFFYKLSVLFKV